MRIILFVLTISLLLSGTQAYAIRIEEENSKSIRDYIEEFVDVPEGAIDWKIFGTTKEVEVQAETEEGEEYYYSKPDFQTEVKALDGKQVKVKGYMFPLSEAEDQKLFLLGPFPLSCPFQYHVGPMLVIEVYAESDPIKFDYDPITITGKLELVPDDPENNVFYRLKEARQVE